MKNGHKPFVVNNPGYVKTLGPVVTIAKNGALAAAEQVVDDEFIYKTSTLKHLGDNIPTDDDKSQWLINRILRDHLLNVEAGNFSGDVTIGGDLTVNGDYVNFPVATTTDYGITRLASGTTDQDKNDVVTIQLLKDGVLGRLAHLEECCEEVQEILKKKYTVTYTLVNAISSNTDSEVEFDTEFVTTITNTNGTASGNPFEMLTVLVGGYDVTDTVVEYNEDSKNVTVSIPYVFGDVEIIARGKDVYQVVGTVDPAAAAPIGTFFNASVYAGESYQGYTLIASPYSDASTYTAYLDYSNTNTQLTLSIFPTNSAVVVKSEHINSNVTFVLRYTENPVPQQITIIANNAQYWTPEQSTTAMVGEQFLVVAGPDSGYKIDKNNPSEYITVVKTGTTESVPFTAGEFGHADSGYIGILFTVTAPITVTITAKPESSEPTVYNVTKNATHATITGANTVQEGDSYTATITPATGYTVKKANISVKNSSNQNVSFTYSNGTLTIPNVTSNITITVIASKQTATTYTITRNYTSGQVTLTQSTTDNTITAGSPYTVSAAPESGFQIDNMTVTQGGSSVAVSNNSATINSVSGNIVVTVTSSAVQEPIPEALQGVSKITIRENGTKVYQGELDIRTSTVNGARQDILPRQYEGSSRGYGVTNGDGSYYFKNGEYHIGGHLYEDEICVVRIQMNQNNSGHIYDAMDWVFGQIDNYNNLQVTNDTKVCYSSTNATNDARIMVYPIKYNPGAPRTIEVPLGVPAGITVDNNHTGGGSTIYVNQDKSRAIYEIVDENDNVIPFEFGNGTFAQQAGIGNASTTTGITDEEFVNAFGWNCFGQFGINTAGTYTFKLRVFGIASRPLYSHEQYIPTAYNNDKDMYRYILGDVDITTADPVTGDAVVTPFRCSITSERSNTSIAYTPYASITGTGTNNEFVQTSVADQGGDTIYIWDLRNHTYGYSQSGTFTEGNCVEIPFILTITDPVSDSGSLAIFCKLVDGQGRTLTSVYSPIMRQDVYSAYALVWNYDKTQVERRQLSEINDWMVEKGSEFNAEFYPQSGYSITNVAVTHNGNPVTLPSNVAQTVNINPVEGPVEITITSAVA